MINFRYHVVSLVAVFLALGVGILFGSSFVAENAVEAVRRSQQNLSDTNQRLRKNVRSLEDTTEELLRYAQASRRWLIGGTLANRPVVLLTSQETEDAVLEGVERTIVDAGGNLTASLRLSSTLDLTTEVRRTQVAQAIDTETTDVDDLRATLIQGVAGALSGQTPGLFGRLAARGFSEARRVSGGSNLEPSSIAPTGSLIVIVAGGEGDGSIAEHLLIPLAQVLSGRGVVVCAAEEGSADLGFLGPLREVGGLVTVDGIDSEPGRVALALALQSAIQGRFGHYGTGKGASAPLPEPTSE